MNVLNRSGKRVSYRELSAKVEVQSGHTSFDELARAAQYFGVRMKGYSLADPKTLNSTDCGVLELAADHLVALVGRQGEAFLVVDSADGAFQAPSAWSAARLESEWTGHVLLVQKALPR